MDSKHLSSTRHCAVDITVASYRRPRWSRTLVDHDDALRDSVDRICGVVLPKISPDVQHELTQWCENALTQHRSLIDSLERQHSSRALPVLYKPYGPRIQADLMSSPEPVEEQCRSDGKTPGGRNGRTGRTHDTSSPSVGSSSKAHLSRRRQVKMGDLRVKVSIPPHPTFWRQKREGFQAEEGDTGMAKIVPTNLHTSVPLSLDEAIKGFTRDITLLDGTVFRFRYARVPLKNVELMIVSGFRLEGLCVVEYDPAFRRIA